MKYTLLVLNLLVFFLGGAIVGIGAYGLATGRVEEIASIPRGITIGAIALGCVLSVVGFFGCCGAGRESRGMIAIYIVFVIILVLCQIAIGVGAFVFTPQVENLVEQGWNSANETTRQWVETTFNCCGFKEQERNTSCPVISDQACGPALVNYLKTRLRVVEIAAIVVASIQAMTILFAVFLFRSIRTEAEERRALLADARRVNMFRR